ncbi:MAG: FapA family protein [Deltaproteobacteria bacterium]|nr:FapA family protein [Deltaproteobacteria bacterium]
MTKDELFKGVEVLNGTAVLKVSTNAMEVVLSPAKPGTVLKATKAELQQLLQEAGITHGILAYPDIEGTSWVIARGKTPEKGEDAQIVFDVEIPADPKDKRIICCVKEQQLARKLPPGPGVPGFNVFGEELPAISGKWVVFKAGEGTEVVADDMTLRAARSGKLELKNGKICVIENYVFSGDLTKDIGAEGIHFTGKRLEITGSIKMGVSLQVDGDLIVKNDVEDGCNISVQGNLELEGALYPACSRVEVKGNLTCTSIESPRSLACALLEDEKAKKAKKEYDHEIAINGDLSVKRNIEDGVRLMIQGSVSVGGIIRSEKTEIRIGGNLTCNSVEKAYLFVEGDLIVTNYLLDARCSVRGDVHATQGKGMIAGGILRAGRSIEVNILGNEANVPTEIYAGNDPVLIQKYEKTVQQIEELSAQLQKITQGLKTIKALEAKGPLDERKAFIKQTLKKAMLPVVEEFHAQKAVLASLETELANLSTATIIVRKTAYMNTEVHIANTFYPVKSDLSELRFYVKDGILEATPLR